VKLEDWMEFLEITEEPLAIETRQYFISDLAKYREWKRQAVEMLRSNLIKECDSEEWQGVICLVCGDSVDEFDDDGNPVRPPHTKDCALFALLKEAEKGAE